MAYLTYDDFDEVNRHVNTEIGTASGLLATMRRALRPNGLFLGAMLGGDTLSEVRVRVRVTKG